MKNKFTKKHKHVLIIKVTQGITSLSLAVVSAINIIKRHRKSSTLRARALSFFGAFLNKINLPYVCASLVPRARKLSLRGRKALAILLILLIAVPVAGSIISQSSPAQAATSSQLNFQGRLLTNTGALVPDGNYHVEFKLYYVSSGGTAQWTETRSTGDLVSIQNGYYSVYLGDVTAFPAIDWSEDLYLGMNIGGSGGAASWDGEMSPRFKLTSVPYAFRAANVASSDVDSADSDDVTITTGDTTTSGNSGDIVVDTGSAAGTAGGITLGVTNASSITLGRAGLTTTNAGALTVTESSTFNSTVNINNTGDSVLTLAADSDNSGESDNAYIRLTQDGGGTAAIIGQVGTAGNSPNSSNTFTNSLANALLLGTEGAQALQLGTNSSVALSIDDSGHVSLYNNTILGNANTDTLLINAGTSGTGISFGDASFQSCTALETNASGVLTCGTDDTGAGVWQTTANVANLVSSTDNVTIGSATDLAKLGVDGDTDEVQLLVQANGTQTNDIFVVEDSTGTDYFSISSSTVTSAVDFVLAASQSLTITGGNTASRPGSPTEGMVYFDSDTDSLLTYANGKWQSDRGEYIVVASGHGTDPSTQAEQDSADYVTDGTSDETEINSALTAAAGGKVVLLGGTYVADATISIPNNTTLQGVGNGTIIELDDLDADENLIENSDTSTGTGVVIENLKLDGRKDLNTAGTQAGIYFNGMGDGNGASARQGANINNVVIEDFRINGLYLTASENNNIESVTAQNNDGTGIILINSSNNRITNNIVQANNLGSYFTGANNLISENVFQDNTGIGLDLASSTYSVASDNLLDGNNTGPTGAISMSTGTNNQIISNTIYDTGGATFNFGITVSGDFNTIKGNAIYDTSCTTSCYAINISGSGDKNTLEGNRFSGSATDAATINDSGTGTIYAGQQTNSTTSTNSDVSDFRFRGSANSTTAFQVQNASGASILNVDTSNGQVEIGDSSTAGELVISDGSSNTITIDVDALAGNYSVSIPTISADDEFCLATAGNCNGLGGLQAAYNEGNTVTTTDARDISFTLDDTATDSDFLVNIATGSTSKFAVQDNGTDVLGVDTSAITAAVDFMFSNGTTRTISVANQTSSNTSGDGLTVKSADGNGTGNGGALLVNSGSGGTTGDGGYLTINGGVGGSTSGDGGQVNVYGGGSINGNGGAVNIRGGTGGLSAGGNVTLQGGNSNGTNISASTVLTTIAGARGTGTGVGGDIVFQTAEAGSSGSSLNSLETVGTFSGEDGSFTLQNSSDSQAAFNILNKDSEQLLSLASSTSSTWGTTTALPSQRSESAAVAANGFVYVIGGANNSANPSNGTTTVYYAKVNSDGTLGSWTTNTNSLPANRVGHTATYVNGYIYVVGGSTTRANGFGQWRLGNGTDTVYFAKVNSDGSLGVWQTAPNNLPADRVYHSAETNNGYLYIIGGAISGGSSGSQAIYYAKVNPDGTVGSWSSESSWLHQGRVMHSSEIVNGRLYVLWGMPQYNTITTIAGGHDTLFYGDFNSDGSMSSSSATKVNTGNGVEPRQLFNLDAINGKLYISGGIRNGATYHYTAYTIDVANSGVPGTITATTSTGVNYAARSSTSYNGNIYSFGGSNHLKQDLFDNSTTTVSYTLTPRLSVGASLDLIGLSNISSTGVGGAGTLTAGNTNVVGNLEVRGSSTFSGNVTLQSDLVSSGLALFQSTTDSTTAFQIKDSAGSDLLTADTTNFLLKVAPTQFLSSGSTQTFAVNGSITGVDSYSTIAVDATATDVTVTLPVPAVGGQVVGRVIYVTAVNGSEDFTLSLGGTSVDISMKENSTATLIWNGTGWTAAGASSSTDLQSAYDNTLTSAGGAELVLNASGGAADGLTIRNNDTTPIAGGILEVQTSIGTNLFSVNNLTTELASNGGAEDSSGFSSDWEIEGSSNSVSRTTTSGEYVTGQAGVEVDTSASADDGVFNNLSANPTVSTTFTVSFAAKLDSGTMVDNLEVFYTRDGGSNEVECTNYSTQTLVTTGWTKVTCTITTDATTATDPDLIIRQADATARVFWIDNLSFIQNDANTVPDNVQIGGGINGGPVTLFTLDRASAPPVADGNDTYLGSMYYDTVTGRIQCYEADGWGACGSAPNNYVNLNPEYPGSVLNGTGVGTMTADFCANEAGVLSVNTSFCAAGESKNYYAWTSPQATQQTYSIYITYQLPAEFGGFDSNSTVTLTARTDDTTDGIVTYEMFRNEGGEIFACGTETTVTSIVDTWQTVGINGDEADGCGFSSTSADDFVIFKINMKANDNANVYASTLSFTTVGQ